ncbi:hypothetical protein LG302_10615 [Halomonas organivorans]
MDSDALLHDYHRWLRYQRQDRLDREHRAAWQQMEAAGIPARRTVEAYRSMAEKAAAQGACYRTLYLQAHEGGDALACEGWLFVRRVLAGEGQTRIRAALLPTFTLEDGPLSPGDRPADAMTLEVFDAVSLDRGLASVARVDRVDAPGQTRFITLIDQVRGDLRSHLG